jgi:UPF0755 protein
VRRLTLGAAVLGAALLAFFTALLAPVRPGSPYTVSFVVAPGESLTEIAESLQTLGVIRERRAFVALAVLSGKSHALKAGPYRASSRDWAWTILGRLARGDVQDTAVTVPEGLWMAEVARAVGPWVAGGEDSFLAAARDPLLLRELGVPVGSAEGYLFPDTYRVVPGGPARDLVRAMVQHFFRNWNGDLAERARARGVALHEAVTMASIVEAEARVAEERPRIAAVYWNRLREGLPLQADPTVVYAMGERRGRTLLADLDHPSPYNTYRNGGLPPGPIGNPGLASLRAALWPLEGCRDLFFVAGDGGRHLFAPDFEGHQRNRRAVRASRDAPGR